MLGCAVFYAAAKAQEVLHFWFRMTSPGFESLFPIHSKALELTTSNDATGRGTKTLS